MTAFLLNEWLQRWRTLSMNLAGSTGPAWALKDLVKLGSFEDLDQIELGYSSIEGSEELRLAIARVHNLDPAWIVVTNGATEAFHLIFAALGKRGRQMVLPAPCYPALPAIAAMHGLTTKPYLLERENHFELDVEQLLDLIVAGTTAFVVVNTPHNPTGTVFSRPAGVNLAHLLEGKGIPLVVDEVFHPIYHREGVASLAGSRNVIQVGDLSKALSLPGLRIGWIIDPDPDRRSLVLETRGYMSLGSSPLLEQLALFALRGRQQLVQRTMAATAKNLENLRRFMFRNGELLSWVPPQGGMTAFPWFRDGRSSRSFCERLVTKDVLLVPGDCFGMPDCVRIGIGCEPVIFEAALNVIENELAKS